MFLLSSLTISHKDIRNLTPNRPTHVLTLNNTSPISVFSDSEAGVDYMSTRQVLGPFDNTTRRLCAQVLLIDDPVCESNPYPEDFSVTMVTSDANVTVVPRRIGVAIDDSGEPECSEQLMRYVSLLKGCEPVIFPNNLLTNS